MPATYDFSNIIGAGFKATFTVDDNLIEKIWPESEATKDYSQLWRNIGQGKSVSNVMDATMLFNLSREVVTEPSANQSTKAQQLMEAIRDDFKERMTEYMNQLYYNALAEHENSHLGTKIEDVHTRIENALDQAIADHAPKNFKRAIGLYEHRKEQPPTEFMSYHTKNDSGDQEPLPLTDQGSNYGFLIINTARGKHHSDSAVDEKTEMTVPWERNLPESFEADLRKMFEASVNKFRRSIDAAVRSGVASAFADLPKKH